MNTLLENIIRDRFHVGATKMEHLRSSAHYEKVLDLTYEQSWESLEALLRRIQIIPTRTDMRHTKKSS
jgi:hypothetical protein